MSKTLKIVSLIAVIAMVLGIFAACNSTKVEDPTTTVPTEEGSTAAEDAAPADDEPATEDAEIVNKDGSVLIMGCSADFPPYEFVEDDGTYAGIDVEIASAICEKMGYALEVKDMDFNGIIAAVESGAVDFGMSGMTVTEERKQSVNFCDTYATGVQVIVVKEGSEAVKSADDLANAAIGVQAGTTGDMYCTDDFGEDHVKQYTKYSEAIQALENDQVDCVVLDNEPAKAFVEANEGLVILETEYVSEDYAACFNFDSTELLDNWNAALAELKADGTIDSILSKYLSAD